MRCFGIERKPLRSDFGWKVIVKDGYEQDEFDRTNPLYLVSVDPETEEYGFFEFCRPQVQTCCVTFFRSCLTETASRAPDMGKVANLRYRGAGNQGEARAA